MLEILRFFLSSDEQVFVRCTITVADLISHTFLQRSLVLKLLHFAIDSSESSFSGTAHGELCRSCFPLLLEQRGRSAKGGTTVLSGVLQGKLR